MLRNSIRYACYDYMCLISQYCEKNVTCIKKTMWPLSQAVERKRDLKWFELIFDLYKKVDTTATQRDYQTAIKHKNFNQLSKEIQLLVKQNYSKHYPSDATSD